MASRQNTFDVIVVGVGTMGAAACFHLARRGVRVLGLEQFDIPHAMGSGHGYSRMIRLAYFEHPDYVPLLRQAYELWRRLENECGQRLLHVTGGVYIGRADSELVTGSRASAQRHNLAHEFLDREQLSRRFPQFHLPEDYVGLYEAMAGWLAPVVWALALLRALKSAMMSGDLSLSAGVSSRKSRVGLVPTWAPSTGCWP